MLQLLNRAYPGAGSTCARSRFIHPERLFCRPSSHWPASSRPSLRPSAARRDYPAYDHDDLENVLRPGGARHPGLSLSAQSRPPRDPAGDRRARARTPSCRRSATAPWSATRRLVAGGGGAPAADRDPGAVPATLQGRPQHQDERDRPCPSAGHQPGPSADAAAPDPRADRITSTSTSTEPRRSGRSSARRARSACISSGDWPDLELELWAVLEGRR